MYSPKDFRKSVLEDTADLVTYSWPTPLVKLSRVSTDGYEVWAKLEFFNPFSRSIKDRVAVKFVELIRNGKLVYEASSGNLGIALACLSNILGVKLRVYLPKKTPKETLTLLRVLGAEITHTDFEAIDERMLNLVFTETRRDGAINPNQFINDLNLEAHLEGTAKELLEQIKIIGREPRCIISGIGTSAHISAISNLLKPIYGDKLKIVGVQPLENSLIPGIKRIEHRLKWINSAKVDKIVEIDLKDAIRGCVEIARFEGILVGLSSGAVYEAYKRVKNSFGPGIYILVFPDDIFKYLSIIESVLRSHKQDNLPSCEQGSSPG